MDCFNKIMVMLLFIFVYLAKNTKSATVKRQRQYMPVTIRASNCVINETHCNCIRTEPNHRRPCLRPIERMRKVSVKFLRTMEQNSKNTGGEDKIKEKKDEKQVKCIRTTCSEVYKCDCEASNICEKRPSTNYVSAKGKEHEMGFGQIVSCRLEEKRRPFAVTGRSSKFHIVGPDSFALFHNHLQIGHGEGGQYNVAALDVSKNDVIGVIVKRGGLHHDIYQRRDRLKKQNYGVKLRYRDLRDELRSVDKNWKCSNSFNAAWLDSDFQPQPPDWTSPVVMSSKLMKNTDVEDFDPNIPWMWIRKQGKEMDVMYCRYKF